MALCGLIAPPVDARLHAQLRRVVPAKLVPELAKKATEHEEWEVFSRLRLQQGGALSKYYPLSEEGRREYEEWRDSQEGNG